jgi:Na+/glutamate symporter
MTGRSKAGPYSYLRGFIDYGGFCRALRRRQSSTRGMAMAAAAIGITQSGIIGEKLAVSLVEKPRVAVI